LRGGLFGLCLVLFVFGVFNLAYSSRQDSKGANERKGRPLSIPAVLALGRKLRRTPRFVIVSKMGGL